MPRETHHAEQLRQDIDHGRTGDKVNFADPAAAPLGTDDEASGFPPTSEQVRRSRAAELSGRPDRDLRGSGSSGDFWRVAGLLGGAIVIAALVIILVIAT